MVLEDLGSTNGTYLNGEPLRGPQPLHVGDSIRIGDSSSPSSAEMLRISEHWHGSDLGRQRQGNEDNYFVRAPLFVVADGMGGAQAGEVASEMAVESFDDGLPDGVARRGPACSIIEEANRAHPRPLARRARSAAGMGTTVTAAYVGERRGHDRPRRRLARLRAARRRADPAHARPLARRRAGGPRQADRGAGRDAPAALGDHPRARPRARASRSTCSLPGARRRRVHGLLGRPDLDGPRGARASRDPRRPRARSSRPGAS